jgi:hypothetical protein
MRNRTYITTAILSGLFVLALASSVNALFTVGGKEPVTDENNWPAGSAELANLASRFASQVGGPSVPPMYYVFLYRGDTAAFNTALAAFARLKAPELLLVVHEGPASRWFLKDEQNPTADDSVDWEFRLDDAANAPKLAVPQLVVYITPRRVEWAGVKVPPGVKVDDQRATATTRPAPAASDK